MKKIPKLFQKQVVRVEAEKDTSDIYKIRRQIELNHVLPDDFLSLRVRMVDENKYRATIYIKKEKGKYSADTFFVTKTSDSEFLFEPPLGLPQVRKPFRGRK